PRISGSRSRRSTYWVCRTRRRRRRWMCPRRRSPHGCTGHDGGSPTDSRTRRPRRGKGPAPAESYPMDNQMSDRDNREPTDAELALTRLADGTLTEGTAEQVRARAQASPELGEQLAAQERAVSLMRSVYVPAPDALRARVEGLLAEAA